jgi:hypothetical protein
MKSWRQPAYGDRERQQLTVRSRSIGADQHAAAMVPEQIA